jgi:hypothetical protein
LRGDKHDCKCPKQAGCISNAVGRLASTAITENGIVLRLRDGRISNHFFQ